MAGAIDMDECPTQGRDKCRCGKCAICGFHKHTAIHGPRLFGKPGDEPFGHEFSSRPDPLAKVFESWKEK